MKSSSLPGRIFSRRWFLTTVLVFTGAILCTQLGIWQLDRLEQRQVFNRQVLSMRSMEELDLNLEVPEDIRSMEWRAVSVRGRYDFENQVALRNQYFQNRLGFHLITPLVFEDKAVMVDRGWIPMEGNETKEDWRKYDQGGFVDIVGQIRLDQPARLLGGAPEADLTNGQTRRSLWINMDLEGLAGQIPYPILPVFVQPEATEAEINLPVPTQPKIELTEGPHFGYAVQWFVFAAMLIIGYPYYLSKQVG